MFIFSMIFEQNKIQKLKTEYSKNFIIDDYRNPPKSNIQKDDRNKPEYRTKTEYDSSGKKILVRFALMKNKGPKGGKTKMTSIWKEK